MKEIKPVYKRHLENHLLLVHSDTTQTPEELAEANENKEQKHQKRNRNFSYEGMQYQV